MQIGILGLGRMGSGIANKLNNSGHEVIGWNRTPQSEQFKTVKSIKDLVQILKRPRVIWLMLPQGKPTDEVLSEVQKYIEKGDIVVDGGNAHYKDTEKRFKDLSKREIGFIGIGVSGGIHGQKNGFALMAGGNLSAFQYIKPILKTLSEPKGSFDYFGEGGAGHFVKMVHNGIEYGMMQSIGEGFEVLKKSTYKFDLLKIAKVWQRGTIISSFLIDRAKDALEEDNDLSKISGSIPRGGEGDWTVEAAKEEKVNVELIEAAVQYRKRSETDKKIQNSYTAKMINALRGAFGGHPVKK